jgi:NIMA (never in mitosis gene a)-related kinase
LVTHLITLLSTVTLGKGAYSFVFKVRRISDGKIYALKKIDFSRFNQKEKDNSLNEISILANIRDNNVVTFHEAFLADNNNSLW